LSAALLLALAALALSGLGSGSPAAASTASCRLDRLTIQFPSSVSPRLSYTGHVSWSGSQETGRVYWRYIEGLSHTNNGWWKANYDSTSGSFLIPFHVGNNYSSYHIQILSLDDSLGCELSKIVAVKVKH